MPDKYIRVDNNVHEKLKIKSAELHISLKNLVEIYIFEMMKKEKYIPKTRPKRW